MLYKFLRVLTYKLKTWSFNLALMSIFAILSDGASLISFEAAE